MGFETLSSREKLPALSEFEVEFCGRRMLHSLLCRLRNIEDFRSQNIQQPNGAKTFRLLAHVKRHVPNPCETGASVS